MWLPFLRQYIVSPPGNEDQTDNEFLPLPDLACRTSIILKKLEELVRAGAVVVGSKPINTPSLNDDEAEFTTLADRLWSKGTGIKESGKGKVYNGFSLENVLNDLNVKPDFTYSGIKPGTNMRFVHRSLGDRDIYWVNTSDKETSQAKVSFRISGKEPEIWDPEDGSISPVSYTINNPLTEVTLNLDPEDALFVVFRKPADKNSVAIPDVVESEPETVTGAWEVHFQQDRGAQQQAVFNRLTPWNENENPGIKYLSSHQVLHFSTATRFTFRLPLTSRSNTVVSVYFLSVLSSIFYDNIYLY
jgi:hypothetical protein